MKEHYTGQEFEERADEFARIVASVADRYEALLFSTTNLTKTRLEAGPKLIEWFQRGGFPELAEDERENLREVMFESKSKNTIEVYSTNNDYRKLEEFIHEIDEIALGLGGEKQMAPLFTDCADNPPLEGYRFAATHNYVFTLSPFVYDA